eukprot:gnl/TRDRNA2_/TRDRNA2_192042_c0_seq1.p1 gnl/TRDRNA2_/TRDRNA2_192042_c0~~gnl/TRDRNA2_/TRDRNA2_192042_c0_seq1.p1  ORF type:complete len:391 (+),score=41.53 gnl/TRDRNA2_/TRDRNA2_192042_c0_seq1:100-1272(+)
MASSVSGYGWSLILTIILLNALAGQGTKNRLRRSKEQFTIDSLGRLVPVDQADYDIAASPGRTNGLGHDRCAESSRQLRRHVKDADFIGSKKLVHMIINDVHRQAGKVDFLRKARLPIHSFLATQNLTRVQLWIWLVDDADGKFADALLAPIASTTELRSAIQLKTFNASNLAVNVPGLGEAEQDSLLDLHAKTNESASRSDLERLMVLAVYGGIYIDTDVVMIRDLWPLAVGTEHWVYQGQQNFMNNAVIKSGSPGGFAAFLLQHIVRQSHDKSDPYDAAIYRYGPTMLTDLWYQAREQGNITEEGAFHMLPACFFDGSWAGNPHAPGWDHFFQGKARDDQVAYLVNDSEANPEPWMYHWHGRWDKEWEAGSVADRIESIYRQRLKLPV